MRFPVFFLSLLVLTGCRTKPDGHDQMLHYLRQIHERNNVADNFFAASAKVSYYDSMLLTPSSEADLFSYRYLRAYYLLQSGEPEQAVQVYDELLRQLDKNNRVGVRQLKASTALAYLRLGEKVNCWTPDGSESCIMPIAKEGVHREDRGARRAIAIYEELLREDSTDLESRWLLNVARMTIGEYASDKPFALKGFDQQTHPQVKPFKEIASDLELNVHSMSGGSAASDFDNDGFMDIIVSSWGLDEGMQYFHNNGDGTFSNWSEQSGLSKFTGGLNMTVTDYNNDRLPDIFVLRGAWMGKYGNEPNSLLRNNGDGTFTDVTIEARLLSFHPTQTATWNDFNNDGWLDVFIGNESTDLPHPCELYINQRDGTFQNQALAARVNLIDFVKGVTSGDYNNDGLVDLFVSTMQRKSYLLRNKGITAQGTVRFEDVTEKAGLGYHKSKTFPTWFWDYDNDGHLDIFLGAYEFSRSLGYYEAREMLGLEQDTVSTMKLFRNNGNGTFTNVADKVGLNHVVNAMGANFGDINNDGFLDMYLGTGNPDSKSVVPNKMYLNVEGKKFEDVTNPGRVGHLQKGHGVSFVDMDHDGDEDIHMQVGGSFKGDSYQNSFYENPGYGNNWVRLSLEGGRSNRFGVGSRVKVTITENGKRRHIFRDVNSGGSFGASPFLINIGLGSASVIDEIEVQWRGSGDTQVFNNLAVNKVIVLNEKSNEPRYLELTSFTLKKKNSNL